MAKKLSVNDFFIYRWRYILGYSAVAIILLSLLVFAGLFVPGGITTQEMASAVTSSQIDFMNPNSLIIINLPYHLLQLLSIKLLGVTVLSVKLPSLIIGSASAIGMIYLLRRWFKYNVAVLAAMIAFATGQFLFVSQNGTPMIMYIFWSVWLLLAATMAAGQNKTAKIWRYIFFFLAALSLYTSFSIYIILTIISTVLLHPHLRYLFRRLSTADIITASVFGAVIASPIIYKIVIEPVFGLTLIGLPTTWPNLVDNAIRLFDMYIGFSGSTNSGGLMLPLVGLGTLLLVVIGAVEMLKTRHGVKSYIVTIWTLLLLPILLLNPDLAIIAFLPIIHLMANGLNYLIRKWYGLFPRNPYARVAGLIPLVILVATLVISGIGRYAYTYHYSPNLANSFSKDISYIHELFKNSDTPMVLIVPVDQLAFYQVAAIEENSEITVTDKIKETGAKTIIIAGPVHNSPPTGMLLDGIVTNARANNADRFYVYKKSTN